MKTSLENLKVSSNWQQHPPSSIWWIIDWDGEYFKKHKELIPLRIGGCCVYTSMPKNISLLYAVKIDSNEPQEITSLGLKRNAWGSKQGIGQCDAILFPTSDNTGDALLFVETKYSENEDSWERYKEHALKQITDTLSQLSDNGCPIDKRNLFGLISCPLSNAMGATVFSPEELMDVYAQYKLQIHMGNAATFQDAQNITFENIA